MLYSRLAPVGDVMVMAPVVALQAGCCADAAGVAGPAGRGFTVAEPALDIQFVIVLRTVTGYTPDATLLNVVEAW